MYPINVCSHFCITASKGLHFNLAGLKGKIESHPEIYTHSCTTQRQNCIAKCHAVHTRDTHTPACMAYRTHSFPVFYTHTFMIYKMLKTVVHGDVFVIVDEKLRPTLSRCFKLSSWVRLTDILTTVPDGHPPVSHLEGTPIALKRQGEACKAKGIWSQALINHYSNSAMFLSVLAG